MRKCLKKDQYQCFSHLFKQFFIVKPKILERLSHKQYFIILLSAKSYRLLKSQGWHPRSDVSLFVLLCFYHKT